MLRLTALPATYGDCLWLEYGVEASPSVILIDAGLSVSKALKSRLIELAAKGGQLELVVVTHVDRDHIGGFLNLLKKNFFDVPVRDIWFNGFRHLPVPEDLEAFGEKQGELLTKLILEKKLPWNAALKNGALVVTETTFPIFDLPGGGSITLLSPDGDQLKRLRTNWVRICGEADLYADIPAQVNFFGKEGLEAFGNATPDIPALANEAFKEDTTEANGSSIAFIFEYAGKKVLFGADAYPSRLLKSLNEVAGHPPYKFDLVKIPHHGSENNVSKDFIASIQCKQFLFSSNGSIYKHPAKQAVSRVIQHSDEPRLLFNYRTPFTEIWDNSNLKLIYKYATDYGMDGELTVSL